MRKIKSRLIFFVILILGFFLRLYGLNWDRGFHLHPDERMLIMVADQIHFFDRLNPNFFNYGSLPVYLLKGSAQFIDLFFPLNLATYQNLLYLGRFWSIIFGLLTICLIFKIAYFLFKKKEIALWSAFFYTIAFFPIQNSHFYTVDPLLTFFATLLLYLLLHYFKNKKIIISFLIGLVFSAMFSTKFTAIIFYPLIVIFFIFKAALDLISVKKYSKWLLVKKFLVDFITFNFSLFTFNFLFMPYAYLEFKKFFADVSAQIKMNSDPYIFPYTLQYVGTTPYLYYLKNIFWWGLGPIISVLSLLGFLLLIRQFLVSNFFKKSLKLQFKIKNFLITNHQLLITFLFYLFYFLVIGRSAVKFMRYMLPIYPFLTILAGYGIHRIKNAKLKMQSYKSKCKIFNFKLPLLNKLIMVITMLWTLFFVNIYSQPHTRIAATEWILKNIPTGSTLAVEHWDDRLPLFGGEKYNFIEMTLYEQPDDLQKWLILTEKLKQTDYIIITSNRLYVPLQKLADCQKYKICYPKTAQYYKNLFKGVEIAPGLKFKKVAEFEVLPHISIFGLPISINDQSADESFTVYDHPKIFIFKLK
jgi:4-amino-4-deoxy-L-arabinose transferase-like glycosyltransferase